MRLQPPRGRYAGINETRTIVLSMVIAGTLAGLRGRMTVSGARQRVHMRVEEIAGRPRASTAFPVALLGLNNPIGIIFSGLFVAYLNQGGFNMQVYGFAPRSLISLFPW